MKRVLLAAKGDTVGSALDDIEPGDRVSCVSSWGETQAEARERVPFGFKMAVVSIPVGGDILKYGEVIGRASRAIAAGDCVHIHNVEGRRGRGDRKGN